MGVSHPTRIRNDIFVRTGDSTDPGRGRRSNRGSYGCGRYESETGRRARAFWTKTPLDSRGRCSGTREEYTDECRKILVNAEEDAHEDGIATCRASLIVLETIQCVK